MCLEKLIRHMQIAIKGLLTVCYLVSVTSFVLLAFQLTASLHRDNFDGDERKFLIGGFISAMMMHLIRLFILMSSGQNLGNSVVESSRILEKYTTVYKSALPLTQWYSNKLMHLQKRLDVYQYVHPISPYSIFDLNMKTFCSTLAAILTYITILMKVSQFQISGVTNSPINDTLTCNFTVK